MRLEDKLMLNGEWAAIDELNKEKVRQANQRLIDEEAHGYQNTSDMTECAICSSLTSHEADYCSECFHKETSQNCSNCGDVLLLGEQEAGCCSECYFQQTSQNCPNCGEVLMLGEQVAINKQKLDYCFECEDPSYPQQ